MTTSDQALRLEAAKEARLWASGAFGYEAVKEGAIGIDVALTAFEAGYEKGHQQALAEVAANLRFLPEGAWPRG